MQAPVMAGVPQDSSEQTGNHLPRFTRAVPSAFGMHRSLHIAHVANRRLDCVLGIRLERAPLDRFERFQRTLAEFLQGPVSYRPARRLSCARKLRAK